MSHPRTATSGPGRLRRVAVLAAVLAAAMLHTPAAAAAPPSDGLVSDRGHAYQLVETTYVSWDDARVAALAMAPGKGRCAHLATITSAREQAVVTSLMAGATENAWLGGYQPPDELSLADGWRWVTGEPWTYTNWADLEPNDTPYGTYIAGSEQYLEVYQGSGEWNDAPSPDPGLAKYFVVEYEACRPLAVEIVVDETIPTEIPGGGGPFVATGPAVDNGALCASGDTINVELTARPARGHTNLKVVKLFTCDDMTGEFNVALKVKLYPSGDTTANWIITGGTGDYAGLNGSGKLVGTPSGPGTIEDVYTGKITP